MKKTKFLIAAAAAITISTGLLSFASANEGSKKVELTTLKVVDNTSSKEELEQDANQGWALAWSGNASGLLAWE